jgi:tetratricopeptide (TPR) repeat protein
VDRIGPFQIRELIARGGAGAVYRCADPRTGHDVAVKVLRDVEQATDYQRKRFRREAMAMAELRHPGIVAVLGAGDHRGSPWLALEYVPGTSLQERLSRQGPLPAREAATLVRTMTRAVAHAHERSVLHRDLKPDNVLLDSGGEPRLTDFGLTRDLAGGQSRLTRTGSFLGTPGYMSPEQACGRQDLLGPPTDVYGLGGILYACLTGEPPVRGGSLAEVLVATVEAPPEPPSKANPAISSELERICLRCLEKDPASRYPTAEALGQALEGLLVEAPGRRGLPVRLYALACLALLALTLGGLWLRSLETTAGEEVEAPAAGPAGEAAPKEPAAAAAGPSPTGPYSELDPGQVERLAAAVAAGEADLIPDFDRVLRLDPANAEAWALRGSLKLRAKDLDGAIGDLEQALRLDPDLGDAWADLGEARYLRREFQAGVVAFSEALRCDPENVSAYAGRGAAKNEASDPRGALADLDQALRRDPSFAWAWTQRGIAKFALEDSRSAIEDLDQALLLNPEDPVAWTCRARAKRDFDDAPGALQDLDRALRINPSYALALGVRGGVKLDLGDQRGALRDLDEALRLDPSQAECLVNRGLAKRSLGDRKGALDDLERAVELAPDEPWSSWARGQIAELRRSQR